MWLRGWLRIAWVRIARLSQHVGLGLSEALERRLPPTYAGIVPQWLSRRRPLDELRNVEARLTVDEPIATIGDADDAHPDSALGG